MAIFDDVKNAISSAAQSVSNMTKDSVEITRLNNESRNANNELTGTYTQLGRAYVDADGINNETIDSLCTRAKELRAKIVLLEQQKMALKNQTRCSACGKIMDKSAKFCSNCGTRMPEPEVPSDPEPAATDITYCPSCGAMRKNEDAYCEVCGYCYDPKEEETTDEEDVIISAPVTDGDPIEENDEEPADTDAE